MTTKRPAASLPKPVTVHLSYGSGRAGIPSPASFRRWVEAALAGARRHQASELSIRIVGTREGRTLNRTYRDKDYATNVLSFPVELPPGVRLPLLGDIAICAPVVRREAAEQGKPVADHWAHMTLHGVLHLLGYDHIIEADAVRMEMLETRILKGLGIADPYQA
jgi:probable rRNA maturation factor